MRHDNALNSAWVRVCSCANLASPASVAGACSAFPGHARSVECDVCPRQLAAVECRPPLALVRWQRVDAVPDHLAPLHPGAPGTGCCAGATVTCASPVWPAWAITGRRRPAARDWPAWSRSSGDRAVQAEASAPCRYLTVPLPARACPAPCSLGREQFRDLTSCARLSPEPGGRDLAEVALADLAM